MERAYPDMTPITIEFSRPIRADRLGVAGKTIAIEATVDECLALAERFGILAVDRLVASVQLDSRRGGSLVLVKGHFDADVVQACVLSLVPVPAHVTGDFSLAYSSDDSDDEMDVLIDVSMPDPPDPMPDGVIDIGEAVAEQLALSLDPFPKAPGAQFDGFSDQEPEPEPEPGKGRMFDALAALKKK